MRWRVSDLASTRGGTAWRLAGLAVGAVWVGGRADVGLIADHGLELADGVLFLLYLVGPGLVVGGLCHVSWLCGVLVMSLAILSISSCTLPVICPITYLTTGK